MKKIEEYTIDELSAKINAIKAERERTANALKKYEEELERRKKILPLGVPIKGTLNDIPYEAVSKSFIQWFPCEASADKFVEYFANFIRALQNVAEDKPIDIKVLLPLLKKGWVAMDSDKKWYWFSENPHPTRNTDGNSIWSVFAPHYFLGMFNLKPAENWETSLMECGL